MGQRPRHNLLLLLLLCNANGQMLSLSDVLRSQPRSRDPFSFGDRFTSIDSYFARHELENQKATVATDPRFTLLAPDLLRTDSQENIYLQADGVSNPVTVSITIRDFSKATVLLQDSVNLNTDNGFYALKTIQISSERLKRQEKANKFVYLEVEFEGFYVMERVVMVSFQSGYIFIQTDKPVYNPGDTVRFRAFVSSPSFKAFDSTITVDIQNTDGFVVKQFTSVRALHGVYGDTFPLSEIVEEGMWKVTAKFDHWQQNTFSSQFEVKKYVLPAFNVTLTPRKSFLTLDDRELEVEVSARYLYGEPVTGTAYVVFGVQTGLEAVRLPLMKQVSDLDGGVVTLTMEELKATHPNIRSLVGSSVYVKASVLTKSGSDLVEAERSGIKIVASPYVLSFKDSAKFFKPGLPFDFTIQVSHHDGSPARNVPVKVNLLEAPLNVFAGSTRAIINMPNDQNQQTITAETTQADLRPDQQARQEITVQPYRTFNQRERNYLYISAGTSQVSVGQRVSIEMSVSTADAAHRAHVQKVTYLVLNKGKIVEAKRVPVDDRFFAKVSLQVSADMMPSLRVVAFYSIPWVGSEEVVSDSVWIDVTDSCAGGLTVGPADGVFRTYKPGGSIGFKISGDPGAKVSLVAVDNAVYLLNKDRLTQSKILNVVEHGDMGCTRGGGGDAKAVFSDAGLLFASSAGFKTDTRQVLQCGDTARRRRSAELLQRKARLERHYREALERRCCLDGLRRVAMPYSCTRRSLYITEGWDCIRAFRYCCATYWDQEFDPRMPTTPPPTTTAAPTTTAPTTTPTTTRRPLRGPWGIKPMVHRGVSSRMWIPGPPGPDVLQNMQFSRMLEPEVVLSVQVVQEVHDLVQEVQEVQDPDPDWDYLDESQVSLRKKFYESWLWTDVDLPSAADATGLASKTLNQALPDSITEWGVLAISASPHTGFCVAAPYNIQARKHFFVDLKLPHSVARNEQIQIKAVVHNYLYEDLQVRVVLMKTEQMCSVAFKGRHTQEVLLPAGAAVAVPFTVVPLAAGTLPLEVMVLASDSRGGDRVQKHLRVVMDGIQKTEVWSAVLNPSAEGGTQTLRMAKVELKSVVPNSRPETFINVRGNVLADSIDNSIRKDSLAALIQMPGGCVEQNLASITLPLIAALYLDRTNGWESVGVQRRAEAIGYINTGYTNQLAYRRSDGSYPPYRKQGASTWITAYVVKVFSMASSIIGVSKEQVCDPLIYLVNNKQQESGTFKESNAVYSTTMTGGLRGDDPEVTLTAFVFIALTEAKLAGMSCGDVSVESATRRTAEYLRGALARPGRRPYTVAIASYALALMGASAHYDPTAQLLRAAASDGSHWPDRENTLFTLEATGYALLALVRLGRMEEAARPFDWLNSQRRRGGGFGSTQSTMVVLHALSDFLVHRPPDDLSLDVDVKIAGRKETRYRFNPGTAHVARSSRLPANLDLEVVARGNGQGTLEVVTFYNQMHDVDDKASCDAFELSVAIEESSKKPPADVEKSFQLTIKVRSLGPRDVRMVVLDISLPTGFTPEYSDLETLSNSVDRYISNFKVVDNLSERGSLIIHLFKVSHREPEILIFRLQQNFKVGGLQPSLVTVYEYYNPDRRCSQTYNPREDQEELSKICNDGVCRCTQGDCCVSKTDSENFSKEDRETFACKSLHHVFQVKLLSVSESYYDTYEVEITRVIKLGVEAGVEEGQRRLFMSHGGCRDGLHLKTGSLYLIIGPKEDQWNVDSDTNKFVYTLGKDTWVERWPSPAECSGDPSLGAKCSSLAEGAQELSVRSCIL